MSYCFHCYIWLFVNPFKMFVSFCSRMTLLRCKHGATDKSSFGSIRVMISRRKMTQLRYSHSQMKLLMMTILLLTVLTTVSMFFALMTQRHHSSGCLKFTLNWLPCRCNCGLISDLNLDELKTWNNQLQGLFSGDLSKGVVLDPFETTSILPTYNPLNDRPKTRPKSRKPNIPLEDIIPPKFIKLNHTNSENTSEGTRLPPLKLRNDSGILHLLSNTTALSTGFLWKAESSIEDCQKPNRVLLVLVHSARDNFGRRNAIRNTWGSIKSYRSWRVVPVFFIGENKATENPSVNNLLPTEHEVHADIARSSSYIDSYANMSYKHMAAYEWAATYCGQAAFVIKIDDDVIMDVFKLISWLVVHMKGYRNVYYCRLQAHQAPHRDPGDKFQVSSQEYPRDKYPKFCSGGAYGTTVNVIRLVHRVMHQIPFLWLDDVFITGLATEYVNNVLKQKNLSYTLSISHTDRSEEYIYFHWERKTGMTLIRDWCKSNIDFSPWTFLLVAHGKNYYNDWRLVWSKITRIHKYNATI